jgi:hypothetical protein
MPVTTINSLVTLTPAPPLLWCTAGAGRLLIKIKLLQYGTTDRISVSFENASFATLYSCTNILSDKKIFYILRRKCFV